MKTKLLRALTLVIFFSLTGMAQKADPADAAANTEKGKKLLQQVIDAQANLLTIGAEMVVTGGHLVYAVCSLLEDEGRGQVERFLDRQDGWRVCDADVTAGRIQGCGLLLTPHHDGSDGFFLARLQKL